MGQATTLFATIRSFWIFSASLVSAWDPVVGGFRSEDVISVFEVYLAMLVQSSERGCRYAAEAQCPSWGLEMVLGRTDHQRRAKLGYSAYATLPLASWRSHQTLIGTASEVVQTEDD